MVSNNSKLYTEYYIHYLDQFFLGEVPIAHIKNKRAYSVTNEGKVVYLKGPKVYPPEICVDTVVRGCHLSHSISPYNLEDVYNRAHKKINRLENIIYKKLSKYPGKGILFIRVEYCGVGPKANAYYFRKVFHVVKGVW